VLNGELQSPACSTTAPVVCSPATLFWQRRWPSPFFGVHTTVVQCSNLGLSSQVVARFSLGDNVTAVVEGFANFFEIEDNVKVAIKGRALNGMAPGTFMV
jgi:hypothetical protein